MNRKYSLLLFIAWCGVCVAGVWAAERYANTPGASARADSRWPAGSGLTREPGKAALVMFVHPHCPCSRASIGELSRLMAHSGERLQASVLFLRPSGFAPGWERTDLWRSAAAIPGVRALADPNGREARRFQAVTSGQTFLYDAQGRLLFSGGITTSRGHAGDNAGQAAILSLLATGRAPTRTAPVFGCRLF
ncbi:MAG TPA: hypothetical protein VFB21_05965 [Chthonomonadaceae bacterium]|nr:hypothetical protein [Chthonomonadaceae bacterium]